MAAAAPQRSSASPAAPDAQDPLTLQSVKRLGGEASGQNQLGRQPRSPRTLTAAMQGRSTSWLRPSGSLWLLYQTTCGVPITSS